MGYVKHFPHILRSEAGRNYYDPMHSAIFEVSFSVPTIVESKFNKDIPILSEQVVSVNGLDALQMTVGAGTQKFLGVDVSYLNPALENTYAELTIDLNLNIRNATDAYVLNVFREWARVGYDLSTGNRSLMATYVAPYLKINEANRDGTVWREVEFRKVLLLEMTGLDKLEYTDSEARKLTIKLRSDYWNEKRYDGIANFDSDKQYLEYSTKIFQNTEDNTQTTYTTR